MNRSKNRRTSNIQGFTRWVHFGGWWAFECIRCGLVTKVGTEQQCEDLAMEHPALCREGR